MSFLGFFFHLSVIYVVAILCSNESFFSFLQLTRSMETKRWTRWFAICASITWYGCTLFILCLSVASMEMQANLHPTQSAKWISTFRVGAHTFICKVTTQSGLVELVHRHLQAAKQPQNNTVLHNWLMCKKSHTTQHYLVVAHQQAVYVDLIGLVLFYHYAQCHHSQLQCRQQSARVSRIAGCTELSDSEVARLNQHAP